MFSLRSAALAFWCLLASAAVGASSQLAASIPFAEIGAKATADYHGDALGINATSDGARLRTAFQKLAGTVTSQGLTLESTSEKAGRLHLVARALGRGDASHPWSSVPDQALPTTGDVSVTDKLVSFTRPGLTEEYSVSVEGVRQDFVVGTRPSGTGDLQVDLSLAGAEARTQDAGARLTLAGSGRELVYHRLHVSDATGRALIARLEVLTADRLRVMVDDTDAVYPVRIDPTFSDADWVSLNPSLPGTSGQVNAIVFDASGNLYIGGSFTVAGSQLINRIAKWDGSAWTSLGTGMNNSVNALVMIGGNLYAGGNFTTAGGNAANRIAKWDGTSWSTLGTGLGNPVNALTVDSSGNLYAGGSFTTAGGNPANRIAKWDGTAWSTLGTGLGGIVNALTIDSSGNLYAGGSFTTAGGNPASRIAKWDGTVWSTLGAGMNSTVTALVANGTDIYAGGFFATADGTTVNAIAKWNGTVWSALGSGLSSGTILALTVSGTDLYVTGNFSTVGGTSAKNIAKWDGTAWSALGAGVDNQTRVVVVRSGNLYAGGDFATAGGTPATRIAKWNVSTSTWSAFGTGMNNAVNAVAVSGNNLYVGGNFNMAGGSPANFIARWDGNTWSALGSGMDSIVNALAVRGSDLYAGGFFTTAGGVTVNRIAKWDGTAWSALGPGLNNAVFSLAFDSSGNLYAGGGFTSTQGGTANALARIAKWDGSAWSALGPGMNNNNVNALVFDSSGNLYAGGSFTTTVGGTANALARVAKWNGSAWSALGSGLDNGVNALVIDGSGNLYAGGGFTTTVGGTANALLNIAKWNGSTWSALSRFGLDNTVNSLALDSSGNLYAGGGFTTAGSTTVNRLAKWNGTTWSAVGSGTDSFINTLVIDANNHLFLGGNFIVVGTTASPFIAQANLNGTPDIVVTQTSPVADGGTVDFGTITTGSSSSAKTFTITNPGTGDLTGLAITKDGANSGDFAVSALSTTSIPVGNGTVTFTVTFTPGAAGSRTAALHIANNIFSAKNPYDLVLTGTGLAANTAPVATPDPLTRVNTTKVAKVLKTALLANDLDADSDPLTITAVGNALPAGATVALSGSFVVYTAPTLTAGNGSYTYTLSDGPGGHTVTGTVNVTEVIPVPANPGPNAANITLVPNGPVTDIVLTFLVAPGRQYRVQYAVGSAPYTWQEFSPQAIYTPAANGVVTHTDFGPIDPVRVYRLITHP